MEINTNNKELIACFLENGFKLDFDIIQSKVALDVDKSFENVLYKKYQDNRGFCKGIGVYVGTVVFQEVTKCTLKMNN